MCALVAGPEGPSLCLYTPLTPLSTPICFVCACGAVSKPPPRGITSTCLAGPSGTRSPGHSRLSPVPRPMHVRNGTGAHGRHPFTACARRSGARLTLCATARPPSSSLSMLPISTMTGTAGMAHRRKLSLCALSLSFRCSGCGGCCTQAPLSLQRPGAGLSWRL